MENLSKQSSASSGRSSIDARPIPSRTPSGRLCHIPSPSPGQSHRQSFNDHLRGMPPSPRNIRHPSFSHVQMQELINNPPTAGSADPAFAGRDWQHIGVGELINPKSLLFVEFDTGIEAATNVGLASYGRDDSSCLMFATALDRIWITGSSHPLRAR